MYSLHSDMITRPNKLTGLKTESVSRSRKTEELGIDTMRFNVCKRVIKQCNVQAGILRKKTCKHCIYWFYEFKCGFEHLRRLLCQSLLIVGRLNIRFQFNTGLMNFSLYLKIFKTDHFDEDIYL